MCIAASDSLYTFNALQMAADSSLPNKRWSCGGRSLVAAVAGNAACSTNDVCRQKHG